MPEDTDQHEHEEESIRALRNGGPGDKCAALKRLSKCESSETRKLILELLYDDSEFVRVQCVQTVVCWQDLDNGPILVERIYDRSELVRRYAIIGLANMGVRDILPIARRALLDVHTPECDRQAFHFAQCRLEGDSHMFSFLCHLFSEDYTIRTSTASFLYMLVNDRNFGFFLYLLELLQSRDESPPVREALERTINEILRIFGERLAD